MPVRQYNPTSPGVRQKTSRTDRFIISQQRLQRFNGQSGRWANAGPIVDGRPR